jgi:hypothetical protein
MSDPADQARRDQLAHLLPEEEAAGSDDPEAQAAAILADSDDRTERPAETMRESPQTPND